MKCPRCGGLCGAADGFCGDCGARLDEGVQPEEFVPEPGEKQPSALTRWFLDLFPGLLSPTIIVCTILATAAALGAILLALFILQMGAMITAFAIGAGGVIIYWTGLCWLLSGTLSLPAEALADFGEKHWLAFGMLTLLPGSLFLALMKMAAAAQAAAAAAAPPSP